MNQPY